MLPVYVQLNVNLVDILDGMIMSNKLSQKWPAKWKKNDRYIWLAGDSWHCPMKNRKGSLSIKLDTRTTGYLLHIINTSWWKQTGKQVGRIWHRITWFIAQLTDYDESWVYYEPSWTRKHDYHSKRLWHMYSRIKLVSFTLTNWRQSWVTLKIYLLKPFLPTNYW